MGDASVSSANNQAVDLTGLDLDLAALLQGADAEESPFGEYITDCPLCKCAVRYYFVNFNEKFKMCENEECDYPFGYDDVEFVKHNEMFGSNEELDNISVVSRPTPSGSVISTSAWSDIDKLNRAFETEDQSDNPMRSRSDEARDARLKELLKQKEAELQTRKVLQDIKKLNVQLQKSYEEDEVLCIKNEKWIKHLRTLQTLSGVQLLKKEEMDIIRKDDMLAANKLTIGIDTGQNLNSITINLAEPSTSAAGTPEGADGTAGA